jgi:hypothetical protein|tara:strand:+ start:518 stop:664 length:147 start_codon:yes stop_codon:yes gene_type:complete
MIKFDDMELLQLDLCMQMTKSKMFMGGDMRRHTSITKKVKEEINRRKI